ncbi:Mitochondrial ribonuclease P catalytic subunit [Pseudolycoriella hygida]|uniref:Mitochondrial ribonuclease P catalytic subunit n=1 Tax=Pseudolycoriella hygida TaxID=35572 RepID=A0A9Q0N958_9DIPT|nr:Mitochondrial ribonuclease P catalytic subunit [Pseudolycoriella hygida]
MLRFKYLSLLKCCSRSMQIHYALRSVENKNRSMQLTLIRNTLDGNDKPSNKEWANLRDNLSRMEVSQNVIDEIILDSCRPEQLAVGKSYVKYLKKSGLEPNTGAVVKLLKLYFDASKAGIKMTSNEQQEIMELYNCLTKFTTLDSVLGEGLIYSLLLTNDWRRCLEILDLTEISNFSLYETIMERVIQEKEEWQIFNKMVTKNNLKDEFFIAYIAICKKTSGDTFSEKINKILDFIHDNEILISDKVVAEFKRAFETLGYSCSKTSLTKRGKCESCRRHLSNVNVTNDEFNELSKYLLDKILIGNNSTAQEVEAFISFIDKTKPYDYIIDALNVAYGGKGETCSVVQLASVVKHYVDRKKTVLVIGRKHMAGWQKDKMDYIRRNSHIFLTKNASEDDTFFLYATLKSGLNTRFVTRDFLHNYASKLDNNLRKIFRKWQQQRQYLINYIHNNGRIEFEETIRFDPNAHQVNGCWHIPFGNNPKSTFQENYLFLQKNWLCVSKKYK